MLGGPESVYGGQPAQLLPGGPLQPPGRVRLPHGHGPYLQHPPSLVYGPIPVPLLPQLGGTPGGVWAGERQHSLGPGAGSAGERGGCEVSAVQPFPGHGLRPLHQPGHGQAGHVPVHRHQPDRCGRRLPDPLGCAGRNQRPGVDLLRLHHLRRPAARLSQRAQDAWVFGRCKRNRVHGHLLLGQPAHRRPGRPPLCPQRPAHRAVSERRHHPGPAAHPGI